MFLVHKETSGLAEDWGPLKPMSLDVRKPPSSRTGHSSEIKASTPTPLFPHGPRILTMSLRSPLISWVLNISAYKIGRWLHPLFSSRRLWEDPVCKAGGKTQSECTLDLVSETWDRQSCPSNRPLWSLISSPQSSSQTHSRPKSCDHAWDWFRLPLHFVWLCFSTQWWVLTWVSFYVESNLTAL